MKKILLAIVLLSAVQVTNAQQVKRGTTTKHKPVPFMDKKQLEEEVKSKVLAVHKAVFVDKDSVVLDDILAPEITYGHSGGKLETRSEVIDHCSHNPSTYSGIEAGDVTVILNGNTAVTRYILTGTETRPDGKATELHLNILQTWIKDKAGWKMLARQATKLGK